MKSGAYPKAQSDSPARTQKGWPYLPPLSGWALKSIRETDPGHEALSGQAKRAGVIAALSLMRFFRPLYKSKPLALRFSSRAPSTS